MVLIIKISFPSLLSLVFVIIVVKFLVLFVVDRLLFFFSQFLGYFGNELLLQTLATLWYITILVCSFCLDSEGWCLNIAPSLGDNLLLHPCLSRHFSPPLEFP